MTIVRFLMKEVRPVRGFVEALLLAVPLVATAQTMLDCPSAGSVAHCETFHFHVQMYRPDSRTFVDLWGTNQFASQAACERARDVQLKRNLTVVNRSEER